MLIWYAYGLFEPSFSPCSSGFTIVFETWIYLLVVFWWNVLGHKDMSNSFFVKFYITRLTPWGSEQVTLQLQWFFKNLISIIINSILQIQKIFQFTGNSFTF